MDSSALKAMIEKYSNLSPFIPIKFQRDVDLETISGIEEYSEYLRGIDVVTESQRKYESNAYMAHLLGYTREISPNELKIFQYYSPGDMIGKRGLEKEYEVFIRGDEGVKYVAVNKFGQQVFQYDNGKKDKPSKNGFDLYLGINSDLQTLAEKLLEGKRGAIVAINPQNGEILAMASSPTFDLSEFTGKVSSEYYNSLINDPDKPFLDRTINSEYPPGSSWKMVVATAGLEEGIITKDTKLYCNGGYQYVNRFFKCLGHHGSIDVRTAIKKSCNAFFYQLALKIGANNMVKYGRMFNFGQLTGIDLPSEADGNFQTVEEVKKRYSGKFPGWLLMNFGIGQGEILVTPVQMASYIAAIANGGTWMQPHIVRKIYNNITKTFQNVQYKKRDLHLSQSTIDIVKDGMWQVVNGAGGTAGNARIDGLNVCGKTSTAQNPHGKDHGWFTCFAPKDNPKIAMAVMVENAGWGGRVCAPIARELLMEFFYPTKNKPTPVKADSTVPPEITTITDTNHVIIN
jgi:penicillin-binding protein 2